MIAYLGSDDTHHVAAARLLQREIDDDFAACPLTLAKVLVGPIRAGRLDAAVAALHAPDVVEQPSPADTAVELARLRAHTGLRMPDCCVLLAAQEAAARVASYDAP